jgi:hypothetical protein
VRQLQIEHDIAFDLDVIQDFNTHGLTLVDLDRAAADLVARMAVRMEQKDRLPWIPSWPEERRDVRHHPCGQRCRLGDYAIAAIAKVKGGVLLTNDREMLAACKRHPDLFPVALSLADIETLLRPHLVPPG